MARAAWQVPVGRRLAMADRRRLVVGVIGIGAALGLILLLGGLWTGLLRQSSPHEVHVGAGFARQTQTRFAAAPEQFLDRTPAFAGASVMGRASTPKEESP